MQKRLVKIQRAQVVSFKRAQTREGHFDEKVFQAFVKTIGIYPSGSLVRLKSGRLAIVLEQRSKSLLTPVVKVLIECADHARNARLEPLAGNDCQRRGPDTMGFRPQENRGNLKSSTTRQGESDVQYSIHTE